MMIQIDGKCADEFSGQIPCVGVCVIPGKLINILTHVPDPTDLFALQITENPDGTQTKKFLKDGVEVDFHGQI